MANPTVAVLFGGRSVEHEVSVISGHQAMDALDQAGYPVLPIYITKQGDWYAGEGLHNLEIYREQTFHAAGLKNVYRVSLSPDRSIRQLVVHPGVGGGLLGGKSPKLWAEVFFPVFHGTHGEDGSLQGLFELADVPYVGSGVLASAIGMDKIRQKGVFEAAGLTVLDCLELSRAEWEPGRDALVARVEAKYAYPVMVKPVSLGSSVGVSSCADRAALAEALDLAFELDGRALVEQALTDFIEINCSVLGPPDRASACEQPVRSDSVLSFDDKYKQGGSKKLGRGQAPSAGMAGLQRLVPAPIGDALTAEVKSAALKAFAAIGAAGVVRVDFLYDQARRRLFINEINTTPGSLSYYLWEEEGLRFDQLVAELVRIALDRHEQQRATVYTFSANLLTK
jgi:D-alanine-D-alanine ligase